MQFEFLQTGFTEIERITSWCMAQELPYTLQDGTIWYKQQTIVQPIHPLYRPAATDRDTAASILHTLEAGVIRWVRRAGPQNSPYPANCYVISRNRPPALEELPTVSRQYLDRALTHCQVRRIDADWLGRHGYLVYARSQQAQRYYRTAAHFPDERTFRLWHMRDQAFDDLFHYFGVFYESRLIGYMRCTVFRRGEVHLSQISLDPEYECFRPVEALAWQVLQYYFEHCDTRVFIAEADPLERGSTEASIFLDTFDFERIPMHLQVIFRRGWHYPISLMRPFRRLVGRLNPSWHSYLELDRRAAYRD